MLQFTSYLQGKCEQLEKNIVTFAACLFAWCISFESTSIFFKCKNEQLLILEKPKCSRCLLPPPKDQPYHAAQGHEQPIFHMLYRQQNSSPEQKCLRIIRGNLQHLEVWTKRKGQWQRIQIQAKKSDISEHCIWALKWNARIVCAAFFTAAFII